MTTETFDLGLVRDHQAYQDEFSESTLSGVFFSNVMDVWNFSIAVTGGPADGITMDLASPKIDPALSLRDASGRIVASSNVGPDKEEYVSLSGQPAGSYQLVVEDVYRGGNLQGDVLPRSFDIGSYFLHFQTGFDGLAYIASYPDLIAAFGPNADAGVAHYLQAGRVEHRTVSFDGLAYIASYPDLIAAFGPNADAGAAHYIQAGRFEGRTVTFDAAQYLANYADLQAAFGTDLDLATQHFILAGFSENRTDEFLA